MKPLARGGDEAGMVGKLILVWLLVVVVFGLAAVDTASIVFARFHASDLAGNAASEAANVWKATSDRRSACAAAEGSVRDDDPSARIPHGGCAVDPSTGNVSVTVDLQAPTVVVGRVSSLAHFANVSDTETNGPTVL